MKVGKLLFDQPFRATRFSAKIDRRCRQAECQSVNQKLLKTIITLKIDIGLTNQHVPSLVRCAKPNATKRHRPSHEQC